MEPNWVDIANFIVLTLTLFFIIWYVLATHKLAKAAELQNQSFKKQNFETTFFQLLRFHNEIVGSVKIHQKGLVGRECFNGLYDKFRGAYSQEASYPSKQDLSFIDSVYVKFYENHQSDLSHYFRNLYSIISFVQGADVSNKKFYVDLIRAQLSTHEQLILFYHCLSRYGKEKFMPLVVELLKDMPVKLLAESFHQQYYEQLMVNQK